MYTRQEREGILWEFHRSGLSVRRACATLPLFPNPDNLYRWLGLERSGELVAREMPDRASRMHCSHGEGSPAYGGNASRAAARRGPQARRREPTLRDIERHAEQTEWREWAADLPEDPAERARMAEVRLAEAAAVLDVLKAPGPASLENVEKHLAGRAARAMGMGVELADVLRDLSIARSTYHDQAGVLSRPDPKGALRVRVRASFEASGGAYGSQSVWADLRRGGGEPVSWRDLEPGDLETPVVVSEKVVRRHHGRGGPRRGQGPADEAQGEVLELRRRARREAAEPPTARGRLARLLLARAGAARRHRRHRVQPSTATGPTSRPPSTASTAGPICWTVSDHPDRGLVLVGMLRGPRRGQCGPTGGAPAHRAHRRRGRLHERRLGGGVRGVPRGGALDVAQGAQPRQRARRGLLRDAQVRLLRGARLESACPSGSSGRGWTPTSGGTATGRSRSRSAGGRRRSTGGTWATATRSRPRSGKTSEVPHAPNVWHCHVSRAWHMGCVALPRFSRGRKVPRRENRGPSPADYSPTPDPASSPRGRGLSRYRRPLPSCHS